MRNSIALLIQAALVASLLSACGQKEPANGASTTATTQPATDAAGKSADAPAMSNDMPMPMDDKAAAQEHSATGMVTAVDATAGTVTIAHGAVASANWPAMTMTFKLADPKQAATLHANDHVKFTFTLDEKQDATVTMIAPTAEGM
jgi:Cu/Ag efflux protein CusF